MLISQQERDSQLWQALQNGDPDALSVLFYEHYDTLFRYGQKLTNDVLLTKEIIQDVFFKLWERRQNLSAVHSIKVYLLGAFRNAWIDKTRHLLTVKNYHALEPQNKTENSPEDFWVKEEQNTINTQKLKKAIAQLPNRVGEAINLRFFEEMDYADIAAVMGLKERTVYNFVHEGLTSLRTILVQALSICCSIFF
jgi:RNA polymerase sigma factor (sigma-70 family)